MAQFQNGINTLKVRIVDIFGNVSRMYGSLDLFVDSGNPAIMGFNATFLKENSAQVKVGFSAISDAFSGPSTIWKIELKTLEDTLLSTTSILTEIKETVLNVNAAYPLIKVVGSFFDVAGNTTSIERIISKSSSVHSGQQGISGL